MAKIVVAGRECYIPRVFLVMLALVSLCEAGGLLRPVRGLARPRGARAKDPSAAQASRAIHGLDPMEKVFNVLDFKADASGNAILPR